MADRRMFAKTIVTSDAFFDMPPSARCLYYTLGMFADDDGFVNNPKSIMRQAGACQDDLNLLLTERFILAFDSGVIVIKHWKINNYIQKDRYKETKYIEEKSTITIDEKGAYTKRIQDVYKMDTQVRLGQESIVKDNKGICASPRRFTKPSLDEVSAYCAERGNNVDAEKWYDYYESNGWRVGKNAMKDWKAAVRTWEKREDYKPKGETKSEVPKYGNFNIEEAFEIAMERSYGED